MINAQYRTGDGSHKYLTEGELAEILARPNVAEPYDIDLAVASESDDDEITAQCYEVYADHETPDEYPDGDAYADNIIVLPAGYEWASDDRRAIQISDDAR